MHQFSICILRLSSLGDIILTTPLIRAIRKAFPDACIDMIIADHFSEVIQNNPHINSVLTINTKSGLIDFFKQILSIRKDKPKYDIIIDLHDSIRSKFIRFYLGKKWFTYDKYRSLKRELIHDKHRVPLHDIIPVPLRYFSAVSEYPHIKPDSKGAEFWLPDEIQSAPLYPPNFRNNNNISNCIALCPGAHHATKRWPIEYFISLATSIHHIMGKNIILLGSQNDIEICNDIATSLPFSINNQAGKCTLTETAILMDSCDAIICNDSGLMHLASSRRRPTLVIYGSTVPDFGFIPFDTKHSIVESDIQCRPCTHIGLSKCPKQHFNCMNSIKPEQVFKKLEDLIS